MRHRAGGWQRSAARLQGAKRSTPAMISGIPGAENVLPGIWKV